MEVSIQLYKRALQFGHGFWTLKTNIKNSSKTRPQFDDNRIPESVFRDFEDFKGKPDQTK